MLNRYAILIKFRKRWIRKDTEGKKQTFKPEDLEYVNDGFGGLETILTHAAPLVIKIPAMPSPAELDKWVTDTLKKQVLKTLQTEEALAYQEVLDNISHLQEVIENKELLRTLKDRANSNS